MNRQILKVSFNRFDADAQGGGNFLSGYMPILFFCLAYNLLKHSLAILFKERNQCVAHGIIGPDKE